MKPIRSLHIVHSFDNRQGGVVHASLSIAKYLNRAGHPAQVVASKAPGDDVGYLETRYAEVRCHPLPRGFPRRYFNAPAINGWLERQADNFNLLVLHSVWTATTARAGMFCRRTGKPYLLFPHNSLDPFDLNKHSRLKRFLGPIYVRGVVSGAAGVACTSERERDRLVTFGGRSRTFIVPLPVPNDRHLSDDSGNFRAARGIPNDAFVVLFMSRFDSKKGLQFLIPALKNLKAQFRNLWLLLAGAGSPEFTGEVDRLLDSNGVRPWTTLAGFVSGEEKEAAFAASNLFVLPSLNENFGIVVVEALRAGVAAVISDEVFIYPELEREGAALICKPTTSSCEASIRRVLLGELDCEAMVSRGRRLAKDYFSPEAATQRLIGVFEEVLAERNQSVSSTHDSVEHL